jgi:hypothetical protein
VQVEDGSSSNQTTSRQARSISTPIKPVFQKVFMLTLGTSRLHHNVLKDGRLQLQVAIPVCFQVLPLMRRVSCAVQGIYIPLCHSLQFYNLETQANIKLLSGLAYIDDRCVATPGLTLAVGLCNTNPTVLTVTSISAYSNWITSDGRYDSTGGYIKGDFLPAPTVQLRYKPETTPTPTPIPTAPSTSTPMTTSSLSSLGDSFPSSSWTSGSSRIGSEVVGEERSTSTPPDEAQETGSNGTIQASNNSGLSTGAKAAIGVVVPLAVIALVVLAFFLLRRRKRNNRGMNTGASNMGGPPGRESGLMVAANEHSEKETYAKPELSSTTAAQAFAPEPTTHRQLSQPHTAYRDVSEQGLTDAYEMPVGAAAIPHPHNTYQPTNAGELAGATASPVSADELSDNDRWSHPQELNNNDRWSHPQELSTRFNAHELSTTAQSVYSDDNTLSGETGEHVESLRARRAAIAEERERIRRLEILREEDERLEREIAEYEQEGLLSPTIMHCYHPNKPYPLFQFQFTQKPCIPRHFPSHPGNHGLSSNVRGSQSFSTIPLSTCSLCHSSKAGLTICSTCRVLLYSIRLFLPSFSTFNKRPGTYGSSLNCVTGVNKALKLNTTAPESGRRRSVCQSTRRWQRESVRPGAWWVRCASSGWPGGM